MKHILPAFTFLVCLILTGCASTDSKKPAYDYTAFKQSRPASILILPPVNNSVDIAATADVFAQVSFPLAESGYYVLPVALVDETLKQNGVTLPNDAHAIDIKKLHEIFGADAVLYMTVEEYGASYKVIASQITVRVTGKLVDLKTGALLWEGSASEIYQEDSVRINAFGIVGVLASAVINQAIASSSDEKNYQIAGNANARLLSGGKINGILYGPRSPNYEKQN